MNVFGYLLLNSFLPDLAHKLPLLIVLIVGFITSITRWRKNPRVSLLTLLAVVIFMVTLILDTFSTSVLPSLLYSTNMEYQTITAILAITSVVLGFPIAVCWILLLIALFGKQKQKTPVVEP